MKTSYFNPNSSYKCLRTIKKDDNIVVENGNIYETDDKGYMLLQNGSKSRIYMTKDFEEIKKES